MSKKSYKMPIIVSVVRKTIDKTKKSKNLFSMISHEFDTEAQAIFFDLISMLLVGSSLEKLLLQLQLVSEC